MRPYTFTPATEAHAQALAPRLRCIDLAGIRERFGITPLEVVLGALRTSDVAWALMVDDRVDALFGLHTRFMRAGSSLIGDAGGLRSPSMPWVLSAHEVERRHRAYWIASRDAIALMLAHEPHLQAYCDADFRRSIAWLRRLGFKIAGPHLMANSGGIFYVIAELRKEPKWPIQ